MVIFAIIFVGNALTDALGISDWAIIQQIQENKMMTGFMTFFICNNLISSCLSSGAFEIYVDGQLAFSKLETGRMPTARDINHILGQYGVKFNA